MGKEKTRIAILGGTGSLGKGLAIRWSREHDIILGSRFREKAMRTSSEYARIAEKAYGEGMKGTIEGAENPEAVKGTDVLVLAIPHKSITDFSRTMKPSLSPHTVIISPVVPVEKRGGTFRYLGVEVFEPSTSSRRVVSAAEAISLELSSKNVVSALHSVPAPKLADPMTSISCDVPVCGDQMDAVKKVEVLVTELGNMKTYYAGPLSNSILLESLTPLLLNLSKFSKFRNPSIRIV